MKKLYDYAISHEAEIKANLKTFIEKTNGENKTIGMLYDGTSIAYGYDENPEIVWTHVWGNYEFDDAEINKIYAGYIKRLKKLMQTLKNGYVELKGRSRNEYFYEVQLLAAEAQRRCSARIVDWHDFCNALLKVEDICPIKTKKGRAGIQFCIDPNGQTFPKAYKYTPESTIIYGVFTTGGMKVWFTREATKKDSMPEFWNFNEEQILGVLQAAGIRTRVIEKAFETYKTTTGCSVRG